VASAQEGAERAPSNGVLLAAVGIVSTDFRAAFISCSPDSGDETDYASAKFWTAAMLWNLLRMF
jgi:hypothetical protein